MRRVIDLSTPIAEGHFRWPVERRLLKSHDRGPVQATWAGWPVHGFTHMDTPRHFDPEGFTTDAVSVDMVVGEAAVVDVGAAGANAPIEPALLDAAGAHVRTGDIVLLRAGWDRVESIRRKEFWTRAPWVTEAAARWLLARRIRAIGYDFPQDHCIRHLVLGDRTPAREENVTHVVLLCNGVLMFEYLCNLGAIAGARTFFAGLPLKLPGSDGAPVRAVAIEGLGDVPDA